MFERFTDHARRVLVLAQEESRRLDHPFIGTEHILLGLLDESASIPRQALASSGVTLDAARAQVLAIIGQGRSGEANPPFTPRAKKVLELSLREALQLGDEEIGPEHLLLGLIREGEGIASQVLVRLGAEPQRIRQRTVALIADEAREGRRRPSRRRHRQWPPAPGVAGPIPREMPTRTLLAIWREVIVALAGRDAVRTEDPPIGDYVELLLAEALGGELNSATTGRCDVRTDGRRVRVQAKLVDASQVPERIVFAPTPRNFIELAVVLLDRSDLATLRAVLIAVEALGPIRERDRGGELVVTAEMLDAGRDVTEAVRAIE